jgi:hypothetical protein
MPPLVAILAGAERDRFATALSLVAAQAAHGGAARLHFDAGSVPLLSSPASRADLVEVAALGVCITICPTGIADRGIDPALPFEAEMIGIVALLAEIPGDARLIVA